MEIEQDVSQVIINLQLTKFTIGNIYNNVIIIIIIKLISTVYPVYVKIKDRRFGATKFSLFLS